MISKVFTVYLNPLAWDDSSWPLFFSLTVKLLASFLSPLAYSASSLARSLRKDPYQVSSSRPDPATSFNTNSYLSQRSRPQLALKSVVSIESFVVLNIICYSEWYSFKTKRSGKLILVDYATFRQSLSLIIDHTPDCILLVAAECAHRLLSWFTFGAVLL